MKKVILTITMITTLTTLSFGSSLYQVGGAANSSFPPPVMTLA